MFGTLQHRLGDAQVVPAKPEEHRLSEVDGSLGLLAEPGGQRCGPLGATGELGDQDGCRCEDPVVLLAFLTQERLQVEFVGRRRRRAKVARDGVKPGIEDDPQRPALGEHAQHVDGHLGRPMVADHRLPGQADQTVDHLSV